jgi:hypothetical protein
MAAAPRLLNISISTKIMLLIFCTYACISEFYLGGNRRLAQIFVLLALRESSVTDFWYYSLPYHHLWADCLDNVILNILQPIGHQGLLRG